MENCKSVPTPMAQGFSINPKDLPEKGDPRDVEEMRSILGSLMYIQVWSRPEIAFAVNYLARYTQLADKTTIAAARRIL
eukprot:725096-Rhodomonas_salina.1